MHLLPAGIYSLILLATTITVSVTIPLFSALAGGLFLVSGLMLALYVPAATHLKKLRMNTAGKPGAWVPGGQLQLQVWEGMGGTTRPPPLVFGLSNVTELVAVGRCWGVHSASHSETHISDVVSQPGFMKSLVFHLVTLVPTDWFASL